jgi:hypothetical protein
MEDKDDDDDDAQQGKLSEDDESGWVMDTVTQLVQYRKERFRQNQMRLVQLTQRGWGDEANYIRESDMKYVTARIEGFSSLAV